jgi:elongation factor 1-gamma
MAELRIFSYLPNPRIWKATIAARLCGVELDVRGAKPRELQSWLWDFDARPLTEKELAAPGETSRQARTGFTGRLFKTDAFLDANPFGTVPAAFSPDGAVGLFESNSIMRAVARLGQDRLPLYGANPYEAARIDSFLDASLVFARDTQIYLLALNAGDVTAEIHRRMSQAFGVYMAGIERALAPNRAFLCGESLTLADICFVAEITLFSREKARRSVLSAAGLEPIVHGGVGADYPLAMAHYATLCAHQAFAPDVAPYLQKLETDIARDEDAMAREEQA